MADVPSIVALVLPLNLVIRLQGNVKQARGTEPIRACKGMSAPKQSLFPCSRMFMVVF